MTTASLREWLQALLTPALALFATYIAWRQHITARDRLRLDMYDRRFAVYRGLVDLLSVIYADAALEPKHLFAFRAQTNEAAFLFDPSIEAYLDGVQLRAVDLMRTNTRLNGGALPVGAERCAVAEENAAQLTWLIDQLDVAKERFRPYFTLDTP